jgi:hypothetical protein
MKEPERIPLNPETPTAKKVKSFPLQRLYPEPMTDDLYMPDNDSVYTQDKTNENIKKSTET